MNQPNNNQPPAVVPPVLPDREDLRRAMLGTTDGGFIDDQSQIPAGEMFRLAAEWMIERGLLTPPPAKSPVDDIPVGRENAKPLVVNGVVGTYYRPDVDLNTVWIRCVDDEDVDACDASTVTSVVPLRGIPDDHVAVPRELATDIVELLSDVIGGSGRRYATARVQLAALLDGEVTR